MYPYDLSYLNGVYLIRFVDFDEGIGSIMFVDPRHEEARAQECFFSAIEVSLRHGIAIPQASEPQPQQKVLKFHDEISVVSSEVLKKCIESKELKIIAEIKKILLFYLNITKNFRSNQELAQGLRVLSRRSNDNFFSADPLLSEAEGLLKEIFMEIMYAVNVVCDSGSVDNKGDSLNNDVKRNENYIDKDNVISIYRSHPVSSAQKEA